MRDPSPDSNLAAASGAVARSAKVATPCHGMPVHCHAQQGLAILSYSRSMYASVMLQMSDSHLLIRSQAGGSHRHSALPLVPAMPLCLPAPVELAIR